jgi:hypothetical protein
VSTHYRASLANDYFYDGLNNRRYYEATVSWEDGVEPGAEFEPDTPLASVCFGDIESVISSDAFGTVIRVLVTEGEVVKPGQALIEVERRDPTLSEWESERARACRAEVELAKWHRIGRNPLRSLRYALTGHDRNNP